MNTWSQQQEEELYESFANRLYECKPVKIEGFLTIPTFNQIDGTTGHQQITVTAEDGSVVSTHQVIIQPTADQPNLDQTIVDQVWSLTQIYSSVGFFQTRVIAKKFVFY